MQNMSPGVESFLAPGAYHVMSGKNIFDVFPILAYVKHVTHRAGQYLATGVYFV